MIFAQVLQDCLDTAKYPNGKLGGLPAVWEINLLVAWGRRVRGVMGGIFFHETAKAIEMNRKDTSPL